MCGRSICVHAVATALSRAAVTVASCVGIPYSMTSSGLIALRSIFPCHLASRSFSLCLFALRCFSVLLLCFALPCLYDRELYEACGFGDVDRVLSAIAHGADLSWANAEEGNSTPAHQVSSRFYRNSIVPSSFFSVCSIECMVRSWRTELAW